MSVTTRSDFDATKNTRDQTKIGTDHLPVDGRTASKIKRHVSMYERNLSTKSVGVSVQSPPDNSVDKRHALKRYQSHLSELKEAKPTPILEIPPIQVFERSETPVTSPEAGTLSVESTNISEPFIIPETLAINHIPAYLNDPASTLLMTAALNALTEAQAQVRIQSPHAGTGADPMAAALAAASAQIIAATLSRPTAAPPVIAPVEASPPPPPPTPSPAPAPVIIHMNSVSTETDIERPPSPVMAKELHDRMRRSGMTQVYSPHGYSGSAQGSFRTSSSSFDRGGYQGYSSSHSGGLQHSPYGQNHYQHHHQQHNQHALRPTLPTSNSFELLPSRTLSASSINNNTQRNGPNGNSAKTIPASAPAPPLKRPQPIALPPQQSSQPPPQPPQTSSVATRPAMPARSPSPPLPPAQVTPLSLPANAGRSGSADGLSGIASASAGSPVPTARKTETDASVPIPQSGASAETPAATTAISSDNAVTTATGTPGGAAAVEDKTATNINNCSSNSFAHWPDLPPIDTSIPKTNTLHRTHGSDYSILKSNLSTSPASSVRSSRNLTFSDTNYTRSETSHALEREQGAGREAFSHATSEAYSSQTVAISPSYKDFHLKYTNGMQAIESVKSDSFSPRSDLLHAEKEHDLKPESDKTNNSLSTTSADHSELDNNSHTNTFPSATSSPKNSANISPKSAKALSRKDNVNAATNNNEHKQETNKPSISPSPHTDTRTMMDTLLLQTTFLDHRKEVQAQYKAPENVYTKQFHSVDPRVFEVEFEGQHSTTLCALMSTPTRTQYRNSIMELIVSTPNFVHSPRATAQTRDVDNDAEKVAFNASFINSTQLNNPYGEEGDSEYDGSVIESEDEEESKSESYSDLEVHSVRTMQSVHTVHTVHTTESSVPGVHPAQVTGCMIHKLLGTHSEHNLPVESTSRKSDKLTTTATTDVTTSAIMDTTITDNANINSNLNTITTTTRENTPGKGLSKKSDDDKYEYISVDDDTLTSTPPVLDTPMRSQKSTRSRKAMTNPISTNNTSNYMSSPNTSMLQHTSSTRSVHRSFKYDDGIKKHILGRQTTSIKGQNKLHETALEFKQDACLNSIDAKNLKLASVTNRNVLVGWQILILKKGELSLLGLAVITGVRTNMFMQTEYRISSDVSLDCWVRLKRGKGMGGTEFQPLRKVLTTKQCSTKMRVIEYKKSI